MKFYVAKVIWYCEGEGDGPITDYLAITGENFTDVMSQLEDYYGEDIQTEKPCIGCDT